jgi:hypothetical protein
MLSRIVAVGVLVFALMLAVEQGGLRKVGLLGSCSAKQTLADGSQWVACTAGKLGGRPSLGSKSCADGGPRGKVEWWHCPAPVQSTAVGR